MGFLMDWESTRPVECRHPRPVRLRFLTPTPMEQQARAVFLAILPQHRPSSPTLGALQTNNIGSGVAYGDQVLSSVNRIQSRIQDTSNQVRDGVVRTTDALNSRVEQASSKVNRIGEGVVQAGAILSESFEEASNIPAPIKPIPAVSPSGVVQDPNASWRNPTSVK